MAPQGGGRRVAVVVDEDGSLNEVRSFALLAYVVSEVGQLWRVRVAGDWNDGEHEAGCEGENEWRWDEGASTKCGEDKSEARTMPAAMPQFAQSKKAPRRMRRIPSRP